MVNRIVFLVISIKTAFSDVSEEVLDRDVDVSGRDFVGFSCLH